MSLPALVSSVTQCTRPVLVKFSFAQKETDVPPLIQPNYLETDYDKRVSIAVLRHIRNIAAQSPLAERFVQEMQLSAAAQTDEEILQLYRNNGQPGFHATGPALWV